MCGWESFAVQRAKKPFNRVTLTELRGKRYVGDNPLNTKEAIMIQHEMRNDRGVLIVKPQGPLEKEDFATLSREAGTYIETHGALDGFMICAERFPGYKDTQGLLSHLRFVRKHHRNIKKVAFVSDSRFYEIASRVVSRCVHPEVRHFTFRRQSSALDWIGAS